jgi:hypothetical protein
MRFGDVVKAGLSMALCLALAQCHARSAKTAGDAADLIAPPPPPGYAFTLSVALTEKAAARLKNHPETLSIAAHYYGLPTPTTQAKADKDGVIDLGTTQKAITAWGAPLVINGVTYPQTAGVAFMGDDHPQAALAGVANGKALAQVKVTAPHDDLDCTRFQDYVATAQSRQITLVCDVK